MRSLRLLPLFAIAMACVWMTGCGGSSSDDGPGTTPITVSINPNNPSPLAANAQMSLTAVVNNDGSNRGVNWTVSCGSSSCGSFNPASTGSGSATSFTAPSAVPSGNSVTVTATSVADNSKRATVAITITQSAPPTAIVADGTYVYHFAGQNNNGPCFIAGAFTVANGAITKGEQDFSDSSMGYSLDTVNASGSSISMAGSNIQVVLSTSNTSIGNNGVFTLRAAKVSNTRFLVSEFDNYAAATGSIDLQTSQAAPSGGYAFLVSGVGADSNSDLFTVGIGGVLNVSGTSLSTNGSVYDYNFGGTIETAQPFSSGSVTAPDSFGRVSFDLTPNSNSTLPQFILTGYIVAPNQIQLVASQQDSLNDNLGGLALGQGSNTGTFSQSGVASQTYVYGASGVDINGLATTAGGFTLNSDTTVSGPFALNDAAQYGSVTLTGGNYSVDATGRVTLSNLTIANSPFDSPFGFEMYLDGSGNALVMGADSVQLTVGPGYRQTSAGSSFQGSYALTGLGFLSDTNQSAWSAAGSTTVSSNNFTGFTDYNDLGATTSQNVTLSGSQNTSQGTLSLAGLNGLAFTEMDNYAYFPIDGKRFVAISLDPNGLLAQMIFEGVTQ